MLTLGIDPGCAATGYGLVEENGDQLSCVKSGCILTSPQSTSENRLKDLYRELKELIRKSQPSNLAIEKIFFGKNTKTAIAVGQARGIVLLSAAEFGLSAFEYTPLQVKLAVTGYGLAQKQQIQEMVKNLLKLKQAPRSDDAADALAVAICHLHSHKINDLASERNLRAN